MVGEDEERDEDEIREEVMNGTGATSIKLCMAKAEEDGLIEADDVETEKVVKEVVRG